MKKIKVALGQLLVEGGEPYRNLGRAKDLIISSAKEGCDLILLPECLDFGWTHPEGLKNAEKIPGKYSEILCNLSKKFKIHICAGLTEKCNKTKKNLDWKNIRHNFFKI